MPAPQARVSHGWQKRSALFRLPIEAAAHIDRAAGGRAFLLAAICFAVKAYRRFPTMPPEAACQQRPVFQARPRSGRGSLRLPQTRKRLKRTLQAKRSKL
jgi:hypothetical protein